MVNPYSGGEARDYFDYLQERSTLAWIYRKYWLYPKLCKYVQGKTLDVGCGIGDLLAFRKGTIGTDINPRAVDWCRERGHNVVQMEPDQLPFEASEFESAVLDNVLEHIADPERLLSEVNRVLEPGGRVIIGVPGRKGYASDDDHKVFYDADRLRIVMAKAGFSALRILYMPIKSSWLDTRMRQYCLYGVFQRD